uniref:DUF834 domain-containing protein n=1 Tax=Oryza meridionalis TaxID=40149 RepID=A0A0E0C0G8_9ORYZ
MAGDGEEKDTKAVGRRRTRRRLVRRRTMRRRWGGDDATVVSAKEDNAEAMGRRQCSGVGWEEENAAVVAVDGRDESDADEMQMDGRINMLI